MLTPPTSAAAAPTSPPKRGTQALLFLLCFLAFVSNFRHAASYDSLAASLIPFQLWSGEGVYLDSVAVHYPEPINYSLTYSQAKRHWISTYPLVTPLLVAPLYFPTALFDRFHPADPYVGNLLRTGMEKLAAATIAALAVVALHALLCHVSSPPVALLSALAFAVATPTWSISAQGLWPHAASNLLLSLALLSLARNQERRRHGLAWLGLLAGLLTLNRPQNLFFSLALAWVVWRRTRWRGHPFALVAVALAVVLVSYNLAFFSSLTGGYVDSGMVTPSEGAFPTPNLANLAASLVSNRGLLVFCPYLGLLLMRPRLPRGFARSEITALLGAATLTLVHASGYRFWHGGYCYGPRYALDLLPALFLLLAPSLEAIRSRAAAWTVGAAFAWGVALQVIGVYNFPGGNAGNLERYGVWNVRRSASWVAFWSGPQSPTHLPPRLSPLGMSGPLPTGHSQTRWTVPPPERLRPNESRLITVDVDNPGPAIWSSIGGTFGVHAVRLAVSWYRLTPAGRDLIDRTDHWLDLHLRPHRSARRTILLVAPSDSGRYELVIEPLQREFPASPTLSELGAARPAIVAVVVDR